MELTSFSFDRAEFAVYWADSTGRLAYANEAFCRALGYTRDQLSDLMLFDFTIDVSHEAFQRTWSQLDTEGSVTFEATHRRKNGEERVWEVSSFSMNDGESRLACCIGRDISRRKREEEQFHRFFELPIVASAIYDPEGRWIEVNDRMCEMFGYAREALLEMTWADLTHPDDISKNVSPFEEGATGKRDVYSLDTRLMRKDGEVIYCDVSVQCVRKEDGGPDYFISLFADMTDRVNAENALRQSEERLRQVAQLAKLGYFIWNPETGQCDFCSEEFAGLIGMTPEEYLAYERADPGVRSLIHPDDRALHKAKMAALRSGKRVELEYRLVSPAGGLRYVREISEPDFDAEGNLICEVGSTLDITDIRETEMLLRQAQKMEAVGRLTGGVAHDFNNVLAVTTGSLELALDQIENGPAYQLIKNALRASDRGAKLTHRLLAFARQQPLAPKTVDVEQLLRGMSDLVCRTLGEDIDIEIVTHAGQWKCTIDPYQLENVVLNLAINARDAMPDGGKLTIEASNARLDDEYAARAVELEPGQYVCIAVTDTGSGMTEEVMEKAYDPFFTTKGQGEGTGLGLSMAHGFAKQSGGHIKIYSELDEGTTIKVYLPRSCKAAADETKDRGDQQLQQAQGEVVLVVEDNADLRSMIVEQLGSLGYEAVEAEDGSAAVAKLESRAPIDLLLTDVVLPGGMNGRELSHKAAELRPELPTVFMSGYTQDTIIHQGRLDEGVVLLQKPFRRADLAKTLRKAIGG